jgi:hypothetical protein
MRGRFRPGGRVDAQLSQKLAPGNQEWLDEIIDVVACVEADDGFEDFLADAGITLRRDEDTELSTACFGATWPYAAACASAGGKAKDPATAAGGPEPADHVIGHAPTPRPVAAPQAAAATGSFTGTYCAMVGLVPHTRVDRSGVRAGLARKSFFDLRYPRIQCGE